MLVWMYCTNLDYTSTQDTAERKRGLERNTNNPEIAINDWSEEGEGDWRKRRRKRKGERRGVKEGSR